MALDDPWLPTLAGSGNVGPGAVVEVYRYDGEDTFERLDNVECMDVRDEEGTSPGAAIFSYVWDDSDTEAPADWVEALSTEITRPKTIEVDDRLVVIAYKPDGEWEFLFDGLAQDFAVIDAEQGKEVHVTCYGIAHRAWDSPIGGALMRDADTPHTVSDVPTDVPLRFNPKGLPNATPDDADAGDSPNNFPTILDATTVRDPDPRTFMTLPKGVAYLLNTCNADQEFVEHPTRDELDALLVAKVPTGSGGYDPEDPSSYEVQSIFCPDTPLTGKDWPNAVRHLIGDRGFAQWWKLERDEEDHPRTVLTISRPQEAEPKDLWLQARGEALDMAMTNAFTTDISRRLREVGNKWTVQGALKRFEVSVVLVAGFPSQSSDGSTSNLHRYEKTDPDFTDDHYNDFRLYRLAEAGDDHYATPGTIVSNAAASLDAIFGEPDEDTDVPTYVKRRRRPIGDLISKDDRGKPLKATLHYSTNYTGPSGVWDGTGTWLPILQGWKLLPDEVGIYVTAESPNSWDAGGTGDGAGKILKGVEDQCGVTGAVPMRFLLTVVIEADEAVKGVADRRDSSPLQHTVERRIDASDRYKYEEITTPSWFAPDAAIVERDDSDGAEAEAVATQLVTEAGMLDGEVSIPYLTLHYQIGDRIRSVQGVGLGFDANAAGGSDGAIYPVVVGRHFLLRDRRETVLTLSDTSTARDKVSGAVRIRGGRRRGRR